MRNLIFQELQTKRLILRNLKDTDLIHQYKYLRNKKNFPYADYKVVNSIEEVNPFFERMYKDDLKTSLFWMIALKKNDKPIGTLSAWNVDFENNSIELGYSLYPFARGKGYMQEALVEVISFLHTVNKFNVFDIWTNKDNASSMRLARRLGFVFQGYEQEKSKNSDEIITYATYRLTKY